jgi:hypothetical protein
LAWLCPRFEIYGEAWIGLYRDPGGSWRRPTRGRLWLPPWHAGYPVPAPDHRFASLDLVGQKMRNKSDLDVLFGVIEAEALPTRDDPGFASEYP